MSERIVEVVTKSKLNIPRRILISKKDLQKPTKNTITV